MIEKVLTWLGRGEVWVVGAGIATFLVLTWVLRGAVPGKSVEGESGGDSPRGVHPDRIVIGVAFGLILILAGAAVAIGRGIPWSLPIFAAGFGLVLFLIRVNRRHRHTSPTVRRAIDVSASFLDLALLAGILVVVNVLVFRYGGRPFDMTSEGAYSLLKLSVDQVNALDRPLTFTQIGGRGPLAETFRPRVRQLLDAYHALRPDMIRIKELNPYEEVDETGEMMKRVPEIRLLTGTAGGVVIEYGEGATPIVVRNQDLFDLPNYGEADRIEPFDRSFRGEDAITSALLRLREGKTVKIAFTVGHGEPKLDDTGATGLADWRARLVRVGYKPVELHLIENEIAEDVALLVVVGPVDPFKPAEVQRIRAYADRGGPILLLLSNERPSGLEEFLRSNNLELGKGRILDPRANINSWEVVVAASRSAVDHPISAAMASDRSVVLPYAGPIHILGMSAQAGGKASDPVDRNLVPSPILQTGRTSWVESDLKNPRPTLDRSTDDEPGPVTVGVAVSRRKESSPSPARSGPGAGATAREDQPRLVLFSCPGMAENMSRISPANLDLLMNAAGWLRGSPRDTLGISPHTHTALTLVVDPVLRQRLIVVPSFTAVLSIIAMGIIVYVARRE